MSIETMMTLGVAGVIFIAALLLLGVLTLVTRLSLLVLRPAARGTTTMARRHGPAVRTAVGAWSDRVATDTRERALPALRERLVLGRDRLVLVHDRVTTAFRERVIPDVRERLIPAVRDRVVPAARQWFTGDDLNPALAPARQRHRRA